MSHLGPLIYAELLSNIRQISVIAVLPTASNHTTKAEISLDRTQLCLKHDNHTTLVTLPGKVATEFGLQQTSSGKKELSWRLPVAGPMSRPDLSDTPTTEGPWPARQLTSDVEFSCRQCKAAILKRGTVQAWKDLPSDNWAEMMEFWHCHKPDDKADEAKNGSSGHESHEHSHEVDGNVNRGYGANSRFSATTGVGFVDISTFLMAETDCESITTSSAHPESRYRPVSCSSCSIPLGHHDPVSFGIRLYKWRLQLFLPPTGTVDSTTKTLPLHPPQTVSSIQIYTTQFASIIASQVTSRILLTPLNHKPPSSAEPDLKDAVRGSSGTFLSLWILSPSIHFSAVASGMDASSAQSRSQADVVRQHAMKIFSQIPTPKEADALGAQEGVEEVFLPVESIIEIRDALRDSQVYLPLSGRKFKEWDVGLLERSPH